MKLLIEFFLAIVLHPIAAVLTWISVIRRSDLTGIQKLIWLVVGTIWGIGPILYILVGGGELW